MITVYGTFLLSKLIEHVIQYRNALPKLITRKRLTPYNLQGIRSPVEVVADEFGLSVAACSLKNTITRNTMTPNKMTRIMCNFLLNPHRKLIDAIVWQGKEARSGMGDNITQRNQE